MDEVPTLMRCGECRELFDAQTAAYAKEKRASGPTVDIVLCPVCRLRAKQRGIQIMEDQDGS